MSLYEKNLLALSLSNSALVHRLNTLSPEIPYEIFMEHEDVETLNLVHTKTFTPLYATKPHESIAQQQERFKMFQEYPYLYFFGLGNGALLKHLLNNPKHQRIVVIEPDLYIAYVVLNLVDFSEALQSGRLVFLGIEQLDFPTMSSLFTDSWSLRYARVYDLHVMSIYYERYAALIQQSNRLLIECLHQTVQTVGNDTRDALIGLKHHITNLPLVPETPPLIQFFKKARTSDVAILVSTGPSLGKQLPLLKEIAPYVTIFAVDASLPILLQNGIKPDVVTSIERVSQTSRFFKEIPTNDMKGIVSVLSSIQHAEVIESVLEGEKIISLRPLGYIMLTGPKAWGYVGIGMSSANMAYELIYHSQFKTCILIGQDLAYSQEGKSHATGHIFGENDVQESQGDGWTVAYGGEGRVKTTAFWNMFRGFFEKDIAETSKRMLTINATEGGARIFGAHEIPFTQAIALHVAKHRMKQPITLGKIAFRERKAILDEVTRNVEKIKNNVFAWQKSVEDLFLDVAHTCEALEAKEEVSLLHLQTLLKRIDAIHEAREEELFDKVIWHIAQSMMLVQDIAVATIEVSDTSDERSQYLKAVQLLNAYKSWLFALAGSMDAIVKTITYAQGRSLIHSVISIDIYVDKMKIDTITCKEMKAQHGRVFDVEMRGILYDVPDEYAGQNVLFQDTKTKEILPDAFVRVIDRTDEQYNRLCFMASLEEPVVAEKIKEMYCPNAIGFLATEETYQNHTFITYVKTLTQRFPDAIFKVFYFHDKHKEGILHVLDNMPIFKFIQVKNIYDIVNESEIYLWTYECVSSRQIQALMNKQCEEIFTIQYPCISNDANMSPLPDKIAKNYHKFHLSEDVFQKYKTNTQMFYYCSIMDKIGNNAFKWDGIVSLYELMYFNTVDYILHYAGFKKLFLSYRRITQSL